MHPYQQCIVLLLATIMTKMLITILIGNKIYHLGIKLNKKMATSLTGLRVRLFSVIFEIENDIELVPAHYNI